jgi:hypothetical protein
VNSNFFCLNFYLTESINIKGILDAGDAGMLCGEIANPEKYFLVHKKNLADKLVL